MNLKHLFLAGGLGALGFLSLHAGPANVNVALNKTVTLVGSFGGGSGGSVTDGVFLPRGTHWQSGTVWWSGLAPQIEINLGGLHALSGFVVQADDNDSYSLDYWSGSAWLRAWDVPNFDAQGWGMQTRPNAGDNSAIYVLPVPISTDKIRIGAAGGDNAYSISEVQAFGAPSAPSVPDSATTVLLLLGSLSGLAMLRRRLGIG